MARQSFIKDGQVRSYEVRDGKVIGASIIIGDFKRYNPTLADFLADGWTEYTPPAPEPYLPTYSELVEQYIREHGYPTYGAELAVLNNYAESPAEYLDAWQTYMGVRHAAKQWATNQPHRDDE